MAKKKKSCTQSIVAHEMRKYHHGNLRFGRGKKHSVVSSQQAAAIGYHQAMKKCGGGGYKTKSKRKKKKM